MMLATNLAHTITKNREENGGAASSFFVRVEKYTKKGNCKYC